MFSSWRHMPACSPKHDGRQTFQIKCCMPIYKAESCGCGCNTICNCCRMCTAGRYPTCCIQADQRRAMRGLVAMMIINVCLPTCRPPGKRKAAAEDETPPSLRASSGRKPEAVNGVKPQKPSPGGSKGSKRTRSQSRSQGTPDIRLEASASGAGGLHAFALEQDGHVMYCKTELRPDLA